MLRYVPRSIVLQVWPSRVRGTIGAVAEDGYFAFNIVYLNGTGPYTASYLIVTDLYGANMTIEPTPGTSDTTSTRPSASTFVASSFATPITCSSPATTAPTRRALLICGTGARTNTPRSPRARCTTAVSRARRHYVRPVRVFCARLKRWLLTRARALSLPLGPRSLAGASTDDLQWSHTYPGANGAFWGPARGAASASLARPGSANLTTAQPYDQGPGGSHFSLWNASDGTTLTEIEIEESYDINHVQVACGCYFPVARDRF